MASQIALYKQMADIIDLLVENAKKLKEGLTLKQSQAELEALQRRQHEILRELAELNKLVEKSAPDGSKEELDQWKKRIHDKLNLFQTLNQEFFDHVSSQSRIIDTSKL